MAKRVTNRQGFWKPLPESSPHDELGRLAETINHLLKSVDAAVVQLRQFVTDASHELRTPLAVLHGETELLLSKPRSAEEYRQTLCVFDDEFKKLTRIVEGLFTLSMADAGQLHLARERSEEHTSELQSRLHLVFRLLLEKKNSFHAPRARRTSSSPPESRRLRRRLSRLY